MTNMECPICGRFDNDRSDNGCFYCYEEYEEMEMECDAPKTFLVEETFEFDSLTDEEKEIVLSYLFYMLPFLKAGEGLEEAHASFSFPSKKMEAIACNVLADKLFRRSLSRSI